MVEQTEVDDYLISTVWLGLDHGFGQTAEPLIFETMVFKAGDMSGLEQRRYASEDEARAGHAAYVDEVALLASVGS